MDQPTRWTRATVYPDMWVDPADDPRNSEGVSPDGELPTLLDYLGRYRATLLMKCDDLDAEQLARRRPAAGVRRRPRRAVTRGCAEPRPGGARHGTARARAALPPA